jgi:uncharacterized damage-inducible protein DinB
MASFTVLTMERHDDHNGILVELFRHSTWANLQLIDFLQGVHPQTLDATHPGTFGSIGQTLVHIVANEQAYLASIEGGPPTSPLFGMTTIPSLEEMAELARESGQQLEAAATAMQHSDRITGEFGGRPFEMAAFVPLLQAINHGTEHRGQIATILGAAGLEPPQLDCWGLWGTGIADDA